MEEMTFDPAEEWIELYVNPRYLVSTHGRLYDTVAKREIPLERMANGNTYPLWGWSVRDNRTHTTTGNLASGNRVVSAAKAVLTSFEGPGWMPIYLDGDRSNVSLDNLKWTKSHAGRSRSVLAG